MLLNHIIFKFIGVFEDINNRLVNILSQKNKKKYQKHSFVIIVSLTHSKLATLQKWTHLTEKSGDKFTHTGEPGDPDEVGPSVAGAYKCSPNLKAYRQGEGGPILIL
jgi:hypothetical protein